jgi:hypothetical protein
MENAIVITQMNDKTSRRQSLRIEFFEEVLSFDVECVELFFDWQLP